MVIIVVSPFFELEKPDGHSTLTVLFEINRNSAIFINFQECVIKTITVVID